MVIPAEIWMELQKIAITLPDGVGLSITMHTDGGRNWLLETKQNRKVFISTGNVETTAQPLGQASVVKQR